VAPFLIPVTSVGQVFNPLQEAVSKDAERLYAVLTARLHLALRPARAFDMASLATTGRASTNMHSMITVLRRNGYVSRRRSANYSHERDDTPADENGPVRAAPEADSGDSGGSGVGTGDGDCGGVHGDRAGRVGGLGTDSAPPTSCGCGSGCDGRGMPPVGGSCESLDGGGVGGAPVLSGGDGGGGSVRGTPPATRGRDGGAGAGGAPPAVSRGGGGASAIGGPPAAGEDGDNGVDVGPLASNGSGGGTGGILGPVPSSNLHSLSGRADPFPGSFGHMLATWGRATDAVRFSSLRSDLAVHVWEAREELLAPYE